MKFLIVLVVLQNPQSYQVRPVSGPYSSVEQCEAKLTKSLKQGERLARNSSNDLIKFSSSAVESDFSQCISYHPEW